MDNNNIEEFLKRIDSCQDEFTLSEDDVKIYYTLVEDDRKRVFNNFHKIKKLNISIKILSIDPFILRLFPNISILSITGSKVYSYKKINNCINNTDINEVVLDGSFDEDFYNNKNALLVNSKENMMFINDNLKIIGQSNSYDFFMTDVPTINLPDRKMTNEDINEIKKFLEKDINKNFNIYKIFKNDRFMYSYLKKYIYKEKDEEANVLYAVLNGSLDEFMEDIKNICKIIGNPEYISVEITNKTINDIDKLKELNNISNIRISYGSYSSPNIDEFKSMREIIDYFISLIKESNLSPAEQVVYAYDLVKSYIYRENDENKKESRELHSIIKTGNIVCLGYSIFLSELLKELGIKSYVVKTGSHARNIIEINDDKYNIHGKYAFDSTFDSSKERYLIERNMKRKIVYTLEPGDIIIKKYNNLASFSYTFINAEKYENIFGDKYNIELSKMHAYTFDPNQEEELISSIGIRFGPSLAEDKYENADEISNDTFELLLYNARKKEGFTNGESLSLVREAFELRKNALERDNNLQEENIGVNIK